MMNLKNLTAVIGAWELIQGLARQKREWAEVCAREAVTDNLRDAYTREADALSYIEHKIVELAKLEGVSGEGVEYLENQDRENRDGDVQIVEEGEGSTD